MCRSLTHPSARGAIDNRCMKYPVRLNDRTLLLDIVARRPDLRILVDDALCVTHESPSENGSFELQVNGKSYRGFRCVVGDEVHLRMAGSTFVIGLPQALAKAHASGPEESEIRADMPGVVTDVYCAPGDAVAKGDRLLTIESMKLQMTIVASRDAIVERVHFGVENAFERGAPLVSFRITETLA